MAECIAVNPESLAGRVWRSRHFYLFISPFFVLFGIFGLYPLLFSLYLSFVKWDGLTAPTVVGIENFVTLFHDDAFYTALWNTLAIGILHILPMFALAFVFAVFLLATFVVAAFFLAGFAAGGSFAASGSCAGSGDGSGVASASSAGADSG